jgi:tyrosine-protein phosphatase SIW14
MKDRWSAPAVVAIMCALAAWSFVYFRATYNHGKRLRVVEAGRVYRCGLLTEAGFAEAVRQHGIRTVVNLQDDFPDPDLWHSYLDRGTVKESEMCRRLGVRYVWIAPDLVPPALADRQRPVAVDQFLEVMDQPESYPVLIHCKAGLHRTGLMAAVYRMEYQGWSHADAHRELKAHGFGEAASTRANNYVDQYLFRYRPRDRRPAVALGRP